MRYLGWISIYWFLILGAAGHGEPSVAALVSRDAGEPLVARFNLDLAVFFKGRVEPDQAWVAQQSEEDLELLKGDLDLFLQELYVFSEPGTYTFPLLGGDPEVVREIAPGIALPDGHVMPVFTSDEPPEAAVWITASDEAPTLTLVKSVDGKRSRRALIVFAGEEREVFPAVVEMEVEAELDSALFVEAEFVQAGLPAAERFLLGWNRMFTLEAFSVWLFILALGCASRSHVIFWGCIASVLFAVGLGRWMGEAGIFEKPHLGFFTLLVAIFGVMRGRSYLLGVWLLLIISIMVATGISMWAFAGIEERDWATVFGFAVGFGVAAISIVCAVGWVWSKEKTPRWLPAWGGAFAVVADFTSTTWLRLF